MDKYAVWVSVKDRLPKEEKEYFCKLMDEHYNTYGAHLQFFESGFHYDKWPDDFEVYEWLDENPDESPVDRGVEKAEEIFGLDNSWPLSDVLNKLIEAAHILLHKKDYDGHGWEEINHAVNRGKEIVKAIAGAKWAGKGEGDRQKLIDFFVWFRNNGERYIGFSIEKFIDTYLQQTPN